MARQNVRPGRQNRNGLSGGSSQFGGIRVVRNEDRRMATIGLTMVVIWKPFMIMIAILRLSSIRVMLSDEAGKGKTLLIVTMLDVVRYQHRKLHQLRP